MFSFALSALCGLAAIVFALLIRRKVERPNASSRMFLEA